MVRVGLSKPYLEPDDSQHLHDGRRTQERASDDDGNNNDYDYDIAKGKGIEKEIKNATMMTTTMTTTTTTTRRNV